MSNGVRRRAEIRSSSLPEGVTVRLVVLRVVIVATAVLGLNYIVWRWGFSLNWNAWWIAVPLIVAETYSLIDVLLFGMTVWRARRRPAPPRPRTDLGVDVFITTYNEDVELVLRTARAARQITYPHSTWVLDDGGRPELAEAVAALGVGYLTRGRSWDGKPLHAKAGNLNSALMATSGEFILVLDADQVPDPRILDQTLGYFEDDRVALVQTPQYFGNVGAGDPLGSQAPLFYGPIQQGKDGWNAAFFCGSNAVLRREALMQLGITGYVDEVERGVVTALRGARRVITRAARTLPRDNAALRSALQDVLDGVERTRQAIREGRPIGPATYELQQTIDAISASMVAVDLHLLTKDLAAIAELTPPLRGDPDYLRDIEASVDALATRELSPLGAVESVQTLLRSIDVVRDDEAQPVMPLATISVTEDMATSMRLQSLGWSTVYHHERLATGLAPDDLGTMLKQRLRWAQGTMQLMLRQNPFVQRGLTVAQRLMYFSTMWSYLSGFAALVFFASPVVFLCFGILPVSTTAWDFFLHFLPWMIANQLLFLVAARGIPTWRGQQYSLALFPVWIRATTSAIANVCFGRPLDFIVTPKSRQAVGPQLRLVMPQLVVACVLVAASAVGVTRLVLGVGEPIGTAVNLVWVAFDLLILSVLIGAVRYRGDSGAEWGR
jgi:cellulose synthase (UDP-forming)